MMERSSSGGTRLRLLVVIGLLWVGAMAVIGFGTWNGAETVDVFETRTVMETPPDERPEMRLDAWGALDRCMARVPEALYGDILSVNSRFVAQRECRETKDVALARIDLLEPVTRATTSRVVVGDKLVVDSATALTGASLATLAAVVLAGAIWIWTRPSSDPLAVSAQPVRAGSSASPPALGSPTTASREPDRVSPDEVAQSLRELQALHRDGILTDEEYEAKRQVLADQL